MVASFEQNFHVVDGNNLDDDEDDDDDDETPKLTNIRLEHD